MAALLSLPNETLLQVIDLTRPDSIWSFVRCCKRIWNVGEGDLELHRQDIDRFRAPNFDYMNYKPGQDLQTYEFLSELLLDPRRALYVKSVSILSRRATSSQMYSRVYVQKENSAMIEQVRCLFFETVGCPFLQGVEVDEWAQRFRLGDNTAVLCLILTLLPNLKALTIHSYAGQGFAEMIYKISKAINSPHCEVSGPLPLSKLEAITIIDTGVGGLASERPGIYEACMTLPSLRRVEGMYIDGAFARWPAEQEEVPWVSNLTSINFDLSAINADAFTRLLSKTKNLQRLTYGFTRRLVIGVIDGDHTAMSLKSVLAQYAAGTLTHLGLTFNACGGLNMSKQYIGSLRQLCALKHLLIQANLFVDAGNRHRDPDQPVDLLPLLPASIETLTLVSPLEEACTFYTLLGIREKRGECLPHLKTIVYGDSVSVMDGLADECASVGIDLTRKTGNAESALYPAARAWDDADIGDSCMVTRYDDSDGDSDS